MTLKEKVCLIAGASGAIGAAVATRFFQEGATLSVTFRNGNLDILEPIRLQDPSRFTSYKLDVTDSASIESTVSAIVGTFSRIDVLVNCTGIVGPIGPFETLAMSQWVQNLNANLVGSAYLAHAVIPIMRRQGGGRILFFSGGGAAYGRPYFTAYSCAKAALVRFTESLAQELMPANIQVNAIAPGPVKSQMWAEMRDAANAGGPALINELKQMDETGGTPAERAAELATFLASDRSNRLTGRLVSAVWDKWDQLDSTQVDKILQSEAWMLRRVPAKLS